MELPKKYREAFTLVFEGDLRKFKMNPLTTETPWGIPYAVSLGEALADADELREELERTPQESDNG